MKKTILNDIEDFKSILVIRKRVLDNTYSDEDLIKFFSQVRKNSELMDVRRIKYLCEMMQYLIAVKREDRLPSDLLELMEKVI